MVVSSDGGVVVSSDGGVVVSSDGGVVVSSDGGVVVPNMLLTGEDPVSAVLVPVSDEVVSVVGLLNASVTGEVVSVSDEVVSGCCGVWITCVW